jgi:rhamnulokinase
LKRSKDLAAVDLGAQSGRVATGRFDGARLELSHVHRFPNRAVQTGGRLSWDVLRLWTDALDGLEAAARAAGRLDSIGIDSWGVDFALLDANGHLLANPVAYRDTRRAAAFEPTLGRLPPRELYERTGIQLLPINSVFELAAMASERDPLLEAAGTLLLIADLFVYWLSGVRVAEFTLASTTQCLDARTGGWAVDLLERIEVPAHIFPELVPPASVVGAVTPAVAEELGLPGDGATVVAVATHDTASAVAAVPFRHPGSAYISAGTWSLVGVETAAPVVDDATFHANLTNEGGIAGTSRLLRNVPGLWLLEECRHAWAHQGASYSFDELLELARGAPPVASLIDPDDPRFAVPGDMPARIREVCAETGQEPPANPAEVTRCILESLALKHAYVLDLLRTAGGAQPGEVHLVGGGARNPLLCRFTASATGLPVLAGPEEAAVVGNLLAQLMALGEVAGIDEARELVRASTRTQAYEPEDADTWREARERFADLFTESVETPA